MKFSLIFIMMSIAMNVMCQHSKTAVFDADADSYIDFGKATALNNFDVLKDSDVLTITAWVRWGDKSKSGVGNWANIVTAADSSGNGDNGVWWIQHNSDNSKFEFALYTTGRSFIQSTTNPSNGVWYHLACVYDGSSMKLYVNGTEESSRSKTGNVDTFPPATKLNFGRWPNSGNNNRKFDGNIDEVSIWNRALTATQINDIKSNPESVTGASYDATGLLGYWNFDDGTADDLTASGNNGTLGSGTTLPIDLISFEAHNYNNTIELNWATASELNNDYFIIERVSDLMNGHANWQDVGRVDGAGTTNLLTNYSFVDNNIDNNNDVYYYRLKQVDFDGKYEYSNIVAVSVNNKTDISVYPNPSSGRFKIYTESQNTINNIQVFNSIGLIVYNVVNNEENIIDISNQPRGVYFIKYGNKFIRIIKE